jgi:hypothetical protein
MTAYHPQPGLEASLQDGSLNVRWNGEKGQELLAKLAIENGIPTVRELAIRKTGGAWRTVGRDLIPEFSLTTGVRRTGHDLPYENRWDVFWDAPLNNVKEVRRFQCSYHADCCKVTTEGARLEISFPGLTMGSFSGDLRFTVYRGSNLLRLEAIAKTDEPSIAYIYRGGLKGARLQGDGDALPHGVHSGIDGFWKPRHDTSVDTPHAFDGRQHRPHLRLPR